MIKKIYVTGASGYLAQVFQSAQTKGLSDECQIVRVGRSVNSISWSDFAAKSITDSDFVINFASPIVTGDSTISFKNEQKRIITCLQQCFQKKQGTLINISSTSVVDIAQGIAVNPVTLRYGRSKIYVEDCINKMGVNSLNLRIPSIVGMPLGGGGYPNPNFFINLLLRKLSQCTIINPSHKTNALVCAKDLVTFIWLLVSKECCFKVENVNFCCSAPFKKGELVEIFGDIDFMLKDDVEYPEQIYDHNALENEFDYTPAEARKTLQVLEENFLQLRS